jgi:DNA polymerase III epsilon subunit-like protein
MTFGSNWAAFTAAASKKRTNRTDSRCAVERQSKKSKVSKVVNKSTTQIREYDNANDDAAGATVEAAVLHRVLNKQNSGFIEDGVVKGTIDVQQIPHGRQSASAVCSLIRGDESGGKGKLPSGLHVTDGKVTSVVAIDCEMVGLGADGSEDALARASIVNFEGRVLYDQFVKPPRKVTDYRTQWSGIRPADLINAIPFKLAQDEVAKLLHGRIVVGHGVRSDFSALMLKHPRRLIRDTLLFRPLCPRGPKKLKHICKEVLNLDIQDGEHDSVEDARAVLAIYKRVRKQWEKKIVEKRHSKKAKPGKNSIDHTKA